MARPRKNPGRTDEPITIEPPTQEAEHLWRKLTELAHEFGPEQGWCLIGGLMVQLHAYEHATGSRPTSDIDILGDARRRPSMTERLAMTLKRLGGELRRPPRTDAKIGYQFEIDGETVEILGPEGLRDYPRTLGSFETIMVSGGTQALKRTEPVRVSIGDAAPVIVRRSTLLGSILIKARAIANARDKLAEHREDLIRLLTFVDDPRGLAESEGLTETERKWLRAIEPDMVFDDAAGRGPFSSPQLRRARQTFALLT